MSDWYVPRVQLRHGIVGSGENAPGMHGTSALAPSLQNAPFTQSSHAGWPVLDWKRPRSQAAHGTSGEGEDSPCWHGSCS